MTQCTGNSNTTFNRCEKLKKNLECFDKQQTPKDENFRRDSNSASRHTEQFLNKLENERSNVFIFNQQTNWTGGNYGFLEAVLPDDALDLVYGMMTIFPKRPLIENV